MKKAVTPKKLVHYTFFIIMVWISYRFYVTYRAQQQDTHKPYGPRDIRRGQVHRKGQEVEDMGKAQAVDLDKRLQELDKEIDRQKQLKNQQRQNRNPYHPADKNLQDKNVYVEKLEQNSDNLAQGPQDEEQRWGKDDPLGDAGMDVKKAENEEFGDELENEGEEEGDVDTGIDNQVQRLMGVRKKPVADNDEEGPPPPKKEEDPHKNHKHDFKLEPEVDWALEEELKQRRNKYNEQVAQLAEEYNPDDFKNIYERHDHLAFVTAATGKTWRALLQFIYSIQYFYPKSDIGVFDLGLTSEQKTKLSTFCKVTVHMMFIKFWPDHLKDLTKNLWRPMVWQLGLAAYGHIVYIEPERYLYAKNMNQYIEHSRRAGITVVGKKLQYSPFIVTHPEMYYFFNVDTRKLQRVSMFDVTMIIMHNSPPVRHQFMRHLVSCIMEEYCIAPPGSKAKCNKKFYAGSKKYADCHRYDMSAVNILLNKWFDFKVGSFLVRDTATKHYDGMDMSKKVKVCAETDNNNHHDL